MKKCIIIVKSWFHFIKVNSKIHLEDLIGQKFGRLTVIQRADDYIDSNGEHRVRWLCECSCAEHNRVVVWAMHLKSGNTQSCGCIQKETVAEISKKYNTYDLSEDYGVLWTTNTNKMVYFDLDNADEILKYAWHEDKDGYPVGRVNGIDVRMHVFIGCKNFDHINRNKLDNRRNNLRQCTVQQNLYNKSKSKRNTSGIIGVSWHKVAHKWTARLSIDHKCIYLGLFTDKDDAIRARLNAEVKYFGEFAPQNHLYEQYGIKTLQNDCES